MTTHGGAMDRAIAEEREAIATMADRAMHVAEAMLGAEAAKHFRLLAEQIRARGR